MKIDEGAARKLAREWGVTWPISFEVTELDGLNGVCSTVFGSSHQIKLSATPTRCPERVLRHEIGHAVRNEHLTYVEHAGDPHAAVAALDRESAFLYEHRPAEIAARSFEDKDLQIKLVCDESHTTLIGKVVAFFR